MTFVLMTIFSFLTILSKHSKEPVKPETKTHHSSSFQSSKNARLIRKLPPTLRQLPRRMITPPHQEGSQEEPNPFEGGRGWGGPEDGSYVTNSDGERVQSSSFNEINEWSTNADNSTDNSTYEYPQSSSSANSSLTVN